LFGEYCRVFETEKPKRSPQYDAGNYRISVRDTVEEIAVKHEIFAKIE